MNAIVRATIERHHPWIIGFYDAGALQRAMRVVLARKAGRTALGKMNGDLAARFPIGCDARSDGSTVQL
jgi:hypothetical protein